MMKLGLVGTVQYHGEDKRSVACVDCSNIYCLNCLRKHIVSGSYLLICGSEAMH